MPDEIWPKCGWVSPIEHEHDALVVALPPAAEQVAPVDGGRTFVGERLVRLGDVDALARMRFDAIARHLQDIATDDATDAGLTSTQGWLVRRTMIDTSKSPRLGERLELTTFCSGVGRSWAERRTSISGSLGAEIEAVSLWVSIDNASGRPVGLDDRFHSVYRSSTDGRRVSPRLAIPRPSEAETEGVGWPIRIVDIDPYRHANNAAQWAAVEQMLGLDTDRRGRAEIEFLAPIDPAADIRLALGHAGTGSPQTGWLVETSNENVVVHTAFRFTPQASQGI